VPVAISKAMNAGAKEPGLRVFEERNPVLCGQRSAWDYAGLHAACRDGTGVIAGGGMRAVIRVRRGAQRAGQELTGSRNPINVVRATMDALGKLRTPDDIAAKRGQDRRRVVG